MWSMRSVLTFCHVGAQRIIVVDDDSANDEMKKSALLLSKPAGVRVNIFTVDKAIAKMPKVEQMCIRDRYCIASSALFCIR